MRILEFKNNRDKVEVNVFEGKSSSYRNVIDKDPKKLAQILIDLFMYGFPIEKAIRIFNERIKKRDWLGL